MSHVHIYAANICHFGPVAPLVPASHQGIRKHNIKYLVSLWSVKYFSASNVLEMARMTVEWYVNFTMIISFKQS